MERMTEQEFKKLNECCPKCGADTEFYESLGEQASDGHYDSAPAWKDYGYIMKCPKCGEIIVVSDGEIPDLVWERCKPLN